MDGVEDDDGCIRDGDEGFVPDEVPAVGVVVVDLPGRSVLVCGDADASQVVAQEEDASRDPRLSCEGVWEGEVGVVVAEEEAELSVAVDARAGIVCLLKEYAAFGDGLSEFGSVGGVSVPDGVGCGGAVDELR